jgi:hypothetical protein
MERTKCQAIARITQRQCGKSSLLGMPYCWSHYPRKKELVEFSILGVLLVIMLQIVFDFATISPQERQNKELVKSKNVLIAQNNMLAAQNEELKAELDEYHLANERLGEALRKEKKITFELSQSDGLSEEE